jgi:hypothetical protein
MSPTPGLFKLCCCSGSLKYRRAADRWVFVGWDDGMLCY